MGRYALGRARSKDLVNWEQMPVALWPSRAAGEEHVYSGSLMPRGDGTPTAFYTSIGGRDAEQWGALPETPDLAAWRKVEGNPLIMSTPPMALSRSPHFSPILNPLTPACSFPRTAARRPSNAWISMR